jgi:hypothetical protein
VRAHAHFSDSYTWPGLKLLNDGEAWLDKIQPDLEDYIEKLSSVGDDF